MTLVRWNAARELASMEIDRLNQMFADFYSTGRAWAPAVDIYETKDREYVIKADLPEVKKEDVKLTVQDDVMSISGERKYEKEEKGKKYHRVERAYGSFMRSFTLPEDADGSKVSAEYKDGVLKVRLPKSEKAKPKSIEVKVS